MEIYDTANKLGYELKKSKEYENFKKAKETILLNPEKNTKIKDFNKKRYEQQMNVIQSGKQSEAQLLELQKEYEKLIQDEDIKAYFESETRFNILVSDVNKIIADSIKELIL